MKLTLRKFAKDLKPGDTFVYGFTNSDGQVCISYETVDSVTEIGNTISVQTRYGFSRRRKHHGKSHHDFKRFDTVVPA